MTELKQTVASALVGAISPGECVDALRQCLVGLNDNSRISAVRLLHELETEKTPESLSRPAVIFVLKHADTIAEVESMAVSLGVKSTNAPDFVRKVAREEGVLMPHLRKAKEIEDRQRMAAELPSEDALFDEMRTMLIAQMRTGTPKERIAAAQELNRMHEFSSEGYHQARATRKAGELTPEQIAAKFKQAITGAAE